MARTKGAKNRFSAEAKAEFVACYHAIGGRDNFRRWARDNETEFYRLYARLLPQKVEAEVHVTEETSLTDAELEFIAVRGSSSAAETAEEPTDPSGVH